MCDKNHPCRSAVFSLSRSRPFRTKSSLALLDMMRTRTHTRARAHTCTHAHKRIHTIKQFHSLSPPFIIISHAAWKSRKIARLQRRFIKKGKHIDGVTFPFLQCLGCHFWYAAHIHPSPLFHYTRSDASQLTRTKCFVPGDGVDKNAIIVRLRVTFF